jgi:hypothetical protein
VLRGLGERSLGKRGMISLLDTYGMGILRVVLWEGVALSAVFLAYLAAYDVADFEGSIYPLHLASRFLLEHSAY